MEPVVVSHPVDAVVPHQMRSCHRGGLDLGKMIALAVAAVAAQVASIAVAVDMVYMVVVVAPSVAAASLAV